MSSSEENVTTYVAVQITETETHESLFELGRATTAYHEATPDRIEQARHEYENALRRFKGASGTSAA